MSKIINMGDVFRRVIKHYGETTQKEKALEELKELRLEIRRDLDGNGDRQALLEEISDVMNMCLQLCLIHGFDTSDFIPEMERKMRRTLERIEKEQK